MADYNLTMAGRKLLWLDTETTGLEASDTIIQMHAMADFAGGGQLVERGWLVIPEDVGLLQPERWAPAEATHGISLERLVAEGVPQRRAQAEFLAWIASFVDKYDKGDKLVLAGYNVEYDAQMLRRWWPDTWFGSWFWPYKQDVLADVVKLLVTTRRSTAARGLVPVPLPVNLKLRSVCEWLGVDPGGDWHDAATDIRATRKLHDHLQPLLAEVLMAAGAL